VTAPRTERRHDRPSRSSNYKKAQMEPIPH
jgi:hypothetical protein